MHYFIGIRAFQTVRFKRARISMILLKASNIVATKAIHHGFFYTDGVKATNQLPQRTQLVYSVVSVVRAIEERWQSSLGGVNRSELHPLLHQFFTKKAETDRSIRCARARIFPPKSC